MKTFPFFHSLTQQLKKWRRQHQPLRRVFDSVRFSTGVKSEKVQTIANRAPHRWDRVLLKESCWSQKNRASAVFVIAVICLTGFLGQRFYNQPRLSVFTIAPQTIKAPFVARIEDTQATAANRKAASIGSVTVWMIDTAVNQKIDQDLQQTLAQGNKLRQIAGSFPNASTSILSTSIQLYLRNCSDLEWQKVLAAVNTVRRDATGKSEELDVLHSFKNAALAQAVKELKAYRLKTSPQNVSALITTVSITRQRYAQALARYSELMTSKPGTLPETSLLDLSDVEWKKTKIGILNGSERILTQGIPPGLPSIILQQAVSLQVKPLVPTAADALATQMLLSVLQPNLKEDVEQTRRQEQQAASAVAPVMIEVGQGEVIVRAGEVITHQKFLLLDYFNLSRREINWLGLTKLGGLVTAAVGVFGLLERRFHAKLRQRDHLLVLLLTLSTPLLVTVGVSFTNLPAIGLLLGSFYGSTLGVTVVGLLTVLLRISLEISWEQLLAGAAGGLLGSWMAGRMRSREELALLGGAVGLIEGFVYLLVNFILNATGSSQWYIVVRETLLFSFSGLAWSIVALGLSPYLEHLFDLVTPIRLVELGNPNRPLLKRLTSVAPGTFQHTLFVANLAEAAAKALGCNVELVRAGTLYHDIGKMHYPLAFIENQMGGPNKHDQINDPWQSAEIIKKHVSEGLVMARKHRLPTAIQAFIPEHHGTMLIAYFYHQAHQLVEPNEAGVTRPVVESDFRYDGPIPKSRETGIVMLADSCEAALRSLKDVCPQEALAMVNKILRARWQDNQLVDSGLTPAEMFQIAEIFVQVWLQFHHKRIPYPNALS